MKETGKTINRLRIFIQIHIFVKTVDKNET